MSGFTAAAFLQAGHASAGSSNVAAPTLVQSSLETAYQIDVVAADSSEVPPIDASNAATIANLEFTWAGGGPPMSYLVRFTDKNWGAVGDGSGPVVPDRALVKPFYVNKLVWLVVIPSAVIPVISPQGKDGGPKADVETLCVFIDPMTGDFLKAVTI